MSTTPPGGAFDSIVVRCSSLPLLFECSASKVGPLIRIRSSNDAPARTGTASHELFASMVAGGGRADSADVTAAAARYGVAAPELYQLAKFGASAWDQIREFFPSPVAEFSMTNYILWDESARREVVLTGTPDVFSVSAGRAAVLDWKTGRSDHDYEHQLRGYTSLLFDEDPFIDTVTAIVVWLRDQEIETYTITRAQSDEWEEQLLSLIRHRDEYRPGRHCQYCPRSHECDALTALAKRDANILMDINPETLAADVATWEPERVADVLSKARMVAKLAESFTDVARARVAAAGGELVCGDRILRICEEERREVDTLKAWPVLQKFIPDDGQLAGCLNVKISAAESAAASVAGRGNGAAAKRAMAEELDAAGAVSVRRVQTLREFRNKGESK